MKRTITLTCVAVLCSSFFLLSVPYVQAQDDPGNRGPCSLKTLKGSYGTLFNGFVLDFPNPGQNPIVIEARDTYDGAGNMTEDGANMLSGTTQFEAHGTGTYEVNPDCSGALHVDLGGGYCVDSKIQIVQRGNEILGILTTNTFTVSFYSQKQ